MNTATITRAAGFWITSQDGVTCLVSDQRDHILTSAELAELIAALQAEQERARMTPGPDTAVCVICRLEEPLGAMRQLPSGSWLCLDAGGCYRRFNTDREHEDMQGEGHPDGF